MPSRAKKKVAHRPEKRDEGAIDETGQRTGSRGFWSGTISFGLVSIPVELYAATRSTRGSLRMLAPSGHPVARRYFDQDGKQVDNASLARGYELGKSGDESKFVLVTDEELEQLAPEQSRDIALSRFVDRKTIPPLFFERAYILAPTGQSNAAYRLLAATLERTDKAGIASFVMRGKQYVVAIVARDGLLRAETLRFAEELRTPESIGLPKVEPASDAQIKAMRTLIAKDKARSVPEEELADTYWQRVLSLVEKKRKKHEDIVTPEGELEPEENLAEVIDLVAILKKSLGQKAQHGAAEPERAPRARPAAKKKAAAAKKTPTKRTRSGT